MENLKTNETKLLSERYERLKNAGFSKEDVALELDNRKQDIVTLPTLVDATTTGIGFAIGAAILQRELPVKASLLKASGIGFVMGAINNTVGTIYNNYKINKDKDNYLSYVKKIEAKRASISESDKHL